MTDLPRITIPTDHLAPMLHMYGHTALGAVMRLKSADGDMFFEAERPLTSLSSGEQVLWVTLELFASGSTLTAADLADMASVLDGPNVAAVRAACEMAVA